MLHYRLALSIRLVKNILEYPLQSSYVQIGCGSTLLAVSRGTAGPLACSPFGIMTQIRLRSIHDVILCTALPARLCFSCTQMQSPNLQLELKPSVSFMHFGMTFKEQEDLCADSLFPVAPWHITFVFLLMLMLGI